MKVSALATMQDQVIQIQRIQGAKGGYKPSIYGKIPLAALYTIWLFRS